VEERRDIKIIIATYSNYIRYVQTYIAERELGPVAALSMLSASPMLICTEIT
jgi:hypothetical protein